MRENRVIATANRYPCGDGKWVVFNMPSESAWPLFARTLECEQVPSSDSRITLATEKDELGMPKTALDWRLSDLEKHSITTYTDLFRNEWERLELGEAEWEDAIHGPGDDWIAECTDTYHHAGGTRMSSEASGGVVDSDMKVHGIDNLYIGSTSVFPSNGCGNSTLTMMALCMRLADRLKEKQS